MRRLCGYCKDFSLASIPGNPGGYYNSNRPGRHSLMESSEDGCKLCELLREALLALGVPEGSSPDGSRLIGIGL
jgi:hypothetical protein